MVRHRLRADDAITAWRPSDNRVQVFLQGVFMGFSFDSSLSRATRICRSFRCSHFPLEKENSEARASGHDNVLFFLRSSAQCIGSARSVLTDTLECEVVRTRAIVRIRSPVFARGANCVTNYPSSMSLHGVFLLEQFLRSFFKRWVPFDERGCEVPVAE